MLASRLLEAMTAQKFMSVDELIDFEIYTKSELLLVHKNASIFKPITLEDGQQALEILRQLDLIAVNKDEEGHTVGVRRKIRRSRRPIFGSTGAVYWSIPVIRPENNLRK